MPNCAQNSVPECKEWLTEVGLDSPALVVDIVICGIVACNMLKRIPWQLIATMIVNCLDGGPCEEAHSLTWRHASKLVANAGTYSIKEETLNWVIVQRAVSVRHM